MMNVTERTRPRMGIHYIVLTALICVLVAESLARSGFNDVWQWMVEHPVPLVLNLLIAAAVLCLFGGLLGRRRAGYLVGATLLLFAAVLNALKLNSLQTPFFAWDLLYARQILVLARALTEGLSFSCILLAVLVASSGAWFLLRGRQTVPWSGRVILLVLAAGGLGAFAEHSPLNLPRTLRIQNIVWEQSLNYRVNGFFLAFTMNISPILISQPAAYNAELVNRLLEHNQILETEGYRGSPVNLIILMSESFSDLPGLSFSASVNPWENFQQLAARYPSFRLISPTVGGNTSLVEFELLTGLTNALLPTGAIPYDHYVRHTIPSLASILRDRGYRTIALHPFYPWFWSRNVAYENLGFERFLSMDDFEGAEIRGHFISDKSLIDKIIEVIEAEDAPLLIHAVSMQNHMPYDYERYTEDSLLVEADMPDRLRQALSTYLTGVRDADRQLGRLLRYLDGRTEPTICLFFGDHQSVLEAELASYRSDETPGGIAAHYRMAEVPGLLWANKPDLLDTDDIPESLSPCHLPAILLHQMGIALPGHFVHMLRGVQIYPVIHREFVRDGSGALLNLKLLHSDPWIQSLEALQYNLLFDNGR